MCVRIRARSHTHAPMRIHSHACAPTYPRTRACAHNAPPSPLPTPPSQVNSRLFEMLALLEETNISQFDADTGVDDVKDEGEGEHEGGDGGDGGEDNQEQDEGISFMRIAKRMLKYVKVGESTIKLCCTT